MKENDAKANDKTGAMVQSYILRADIAPGEAARTGADESVYGDCPHRPFLIREGLRHGTAAADAAKCYVKIFHGPRVCWKAYRAGSYRRVTSLLEVAAYCAGIPLRIGSYGVARSKISQFFETLSATIVAPFLITLVLTAQFFVQPAWAQAEEATAAALASDEADQAAEVADPPEIPADASAPALAGAREIGHKNSI